MDISSCIATSWAFYTDILNTLTHTDIFLFLCLSIGSSRHHTLNIHHGLFFSELCFSHAMMSFTLIQALPMFEAAVVAVGRAWGRG
jgi:hypothetical protein